MKESREHSLPVSGTEFGLSASVRHNRHWGRRAALILVLSAVQFQLGVAAARADPPTESTNASSQLWSLRIDQVDTGDVSLDPSFESALHKNLLRELVKTKRFKQVFFSRDHSASDIPDLMILKMRVQEQAPSSEARRANLSDAGALGVVAESLLRLCRWSTVNKLNVRIQLSTREGRLVLDDVIAGEVGFTGDNSRATHNLARHVALILKRSTLPDTALVVASEQERLQGCPNTK